MTPSSSMLNNLELLVVSSDYSTLKILVRACQDLGSRLESTPSISSADHILQHRKIDGIIIDMETRGSFELVEKVRKSNSNRTSLIFSCVASLDEGEMAKDTGANFVAIKPISFNTITDLLITATPALTDERKRYFRHKLVVPITISFEGNQHRALTSNMSETGMAVRSFRMLPPGTPVEFSFELPAGPCVKGKGEIMWADAEGRAGIKFETVTCSGSPHLMEWLDHRRMVLS
jgi:response regulator RpfG family c-di-GMP phosphodiesterase